MAGPGTPGEGAPEPVVLRIRRGVGIEILDQTRLPHEEVTLELREVAAVCEAIRTLRVRGAPLLGLTGACGMAIAGQTVGTAEAALERAAASVLATRPTAVDLGAAIRRALRQASLAGPKHEDRLRALWDNAEAMAQERVAEDRAIGAAGAAILPPGAVLTHCNTGSLATGGMGTALGVIRTAYAARTLTHCYATETRPLLQGARLTMWELQRLRIPATLVPDTAAATLIASGAVQAVITGADRIAANGDTANKVGTYGLAVVAARHGVPFFIAAPRTTIDPVCGDGSAIPIEFRDEAEVGGFGGQRWAPAGMPAYNPAFDVTPGELIAAIITERGVLRPPFGAAIERVLAGR